jgi:hypothetical protein
LKQSTSEPIRRKFDEVIFKEDEARAVGEEFIIDEEDDRGPP